MESNQKSGTSIDRQAVRKSQTKFLLVVALFLIPVIAALLLHFTGWRPTSTMNHGALVTPARPMPELSFQTGKAGLIRSKDFEQKWSMWMVVEGVCKDVCLQNLHALRQVHVVQGKNQHRVQRILVTTGRIDDLGKISRMYPDLIILQANDAALTQLRNWLAPGSEPIPLDGTQAFLVDPLTNYMMYYAPGFEPAGVRKDLARLLRVSHIG